MEMLATLGVSLVDMLNALTKKACNALLTTKGMRFPINVILVRIRWHAAYLLSYRHLKEMME